MRTAGRRWRSLFTLALLLMVLAVGATVAYRLAFVSSGRGSLRDSSQVAILGTIHVLYGHVVVDGMGPRRVRAWLSTGDRDRLRTAEYIRSLADYLTRREAFPEVETRLFRVDHRLQEDELAALVAWWLR
jgi:predicted esterase